MRTYGRIATVVAAGTLLTWVNFGCAARQEAPRPWESAAQRANAAASQAETAAGRAEAAAQRTEAAAARVEEAAQRTEAAAARVEEMVSRRMYK